MCCSTTPRRSTGWRRSNPDIAAVLSPEHLSRNQIGPENLSLTISEESTAPDGEFETFREALIRRKRAVGLYGDEVQPISMLDNQLFRTVVSFPANVPVGNYNVDVYLVRDGAVVSAESTPLIVSKVGIGAEVYDFAYENGMLHGIIAIIIAVAAGWTAGVVFRKA